MNRRWFSIGVTSALLAPRGARVTPDPDVRRLFSSPDAAASIGRTYLRLHPRKAEYAALMADITLGDHRHAHGVPLARLVGEWQRRDFAQGRIVVLEGWALSCTEVSLCALLALG